MEMLLVFIIIININYIISVFRIHEIRKIIRIILDIKKFNLDTVTDNPVSLIVILLVIVMQRYDNLS